MAEIRNAHRSKDSRQIERRVNDTDKVTKIDSTGGFRPHQTAHKEFSKRADSYEHHGHQRRAYGYRDGYREHRDYDNFRKQDERRSGRWHGNRQGYLNSPSEYDEYSRSKQRNAQSTERKFHPDNISRHNRNKNYSNYIHADDFDIDPRQRTIYRARSLPQYDFQNETSYYPLQSDHPGSPPVRRPYSNLGDYGYEQGVNSYFGDKRDR